MAFSASVCAFLTLFCVWITPSGLGLPSGFDTAPDLGIFGLAAIRLFGTFRLVTAASAIGLSVTVTAIVMLLFTAAVILLFTAFVLSHIVQPAQYRLVGTRTAVVHKMIYSHATASAVVIFLFVAATHSMNSPLLLIYNGRRALTPPP